MSYNSKKTMAGIAAGIVLIIGYIIYALGEKAPAAGQLKSWATAMLVFIGISVVVMIIIQILFHIGFAIGIAIREGERDDKNLRRIFNSETVEDERDKAIGLRSDRIGQIIGGAGFIVALISLVAGASAICALHIIFGSFAIGSVAGGVASIYHYERGVRNG